MPISGMLVFYRDKSAMRARRLELALVILGMSMGIMAASSYALEPENVLVIYNAGSQDGQAIAAYYQQAHPGVQSLGLDNVPAGELVSAEVYLNTIRPQVLSALTDGIDCIVTTKGLPLRIDNPGYSGPGIYSSLESELARVDSISTTEQMGNQAWMLPGWMGGNPLAMNPYQGADAPFSYAAYGTRLTARLDGFSVTDVTASIDRAGRAVIGRPGYRFVVDDDPDAPGAAADRMEKLVADVLSPRGLDYVYDAGSGFVTSAAGPVIGYVSHGTYGGGSPAEPPDTPSYVLSDLEFDLAKGAVFCTYESFNACSFNEGSNRYGQGLIAEWLAGGGTAGTGHVEEPGVSVFNITNEDKLFEMLLDGYTFAESAWSATMQLSFVNTVVGDPLMRFEQWTPGDVDLDGDVDLFDLSAVKAAYGTCEGDERYNVMADMNANGQIDFWDLTYVKGNYTGAGGSGSYTAVPEPAALCLLLPGAVLLLLRRSKAGSP